VLAVGVLAEVVRITAVVPELAALVAEEMVVLTEALAELVPPTLVAVAVAAVGVQTVQVATAALAWSSFALFLVHPPPRPLALGRPS